MGSGMSGPRTPFSLGGPVFIVAVEDADFRESDPKLRGTIDGLGAPYEFVRASELANPHLESDLYLGTYKPSGLGFVRIFQTARLETFEQGPDGRMFRDGRPLWPEAPVATGRPSANRAGPLAVGQDAALCFWTSGRLRITLTGPLLFVWRQPKLKSGNAPKDWMQRARENLAPDPKPS